MPVNDYHRLVLAAPHGPIERSGSVIQVDGRITVPAEQMLQPALDYWFPRVKAETHWQRAFRDPQ